MLAAALMTAVLATLLPGMLSALLPRVLTRLLTTLARLLTALVLLVGLVLTAALLLAALRIALMLLVFLPLLIRHRTFSRLEVSLLPSPQSQRRRNFLGSGSERPNELAIHWGIRRNGGNAAPAKRRAVACQTGL
jgi:hypothetical protein